MTHKKLILAEVALILVSVLIFRSLWMLLDKIPLMNKESTLWLSLFFGGLVTVFILYYIAKQDRK
ncbi:MAG: hypothetical protein KJ887_04665 [Candidatus Omnitrophica bacterium]|nr:hypothetical protein [Candidatus Omnitrophota bacterium]MBU1047607.1 hypothetical protein [Candidatus Omnitrophota bacterium]MBU1631485.1 hypothetical protein [Candidatus Omnitrophota bacterium]MBU1767241.1 hypothetical protein [Candidatus Omnitrophota bacterium]MBU1888969.1 hypothetical protein [Candidatus Omnitrophota bacterium]